LDEAERRSRATKPSDEADAGGALWRVVCCRTRTDALVVPAGGTRTGSTLSAARWLLVDGRVAVPGSWPGLDPYQSICRSSHDAFDPVIAALAARVAAIGLAT
jgi:hypothetical protein